jgi:hypothetical protein
VKLNGKKTENKSLTDRLKVHAVCCGLGIAEEKANFFMHILMIVLQKMAVLKNSDKTWIMKGMQ